ncbi:MAG: PepSY domain-containing protein [Gammaproteobacteria bacterium]|nr:PepSY domain-containing protein [Gammaproteobacteria bacterium]
MNLPLIQSLARLALACLLAVPLCAQPQGRRQSDPPGGVQGAPSDRDQAASIARRATGGRVLGVKPESGSQRVKILSRDGRVRTLEVDPRTGAVRP